MERVYTTKFIYTYIYSMIDESNNFEPIDKDSYLNYVNVSICEFSYFFGLNSLDQFHSIFQTVEDCVKRVSLLFHARHHQLLFRLMCILRFNQICEMNMG